MIIFRWCYKLNYILGCTAITFKVIMSTQFNSAPCYPLFLNIYASSLPSLQYISLLISYGSEWPFCWHLRLADIKTYFNGGINSFSEDWWGDGIWKSLKRACTICYPAVIVQPCGTNKNTIMLQDMSHIKWCIELDPIPLAGDWDAVGHIHSDQLQSSIHLDQSEAKYKQMRTCVKEGQQRGCN